MIKGARVYPSDSIHTGVDEMVSKVDRELQELTQSTDEFIQGLTGLYHGRDATMTSVVPHATVSNPVAQRKTVPTTVVPQPYKAVFDPFHDDDQVEEILLSHELVAETSEVRLAEDLDEKFHVLQQQIHQYRNLYKTSHDKIREYEIKIQDLERKVEDTEDEKAKLSQMMMQGKVQDEANKHSILPGVKHASHDLFAKRTEEIRKALLFENEEDETNFSMDELRKAKKQWWRPIFSVFTPFKRDIRMIQARYGSSVASYFIFYRYMFLQISLVGLVMTGFLIWHSFVFSEDHDWREFFNSIGYMPYIMAVSSFDTDEGFMYDLMILSVLFILLVGMCRKLVVEDRLAKDLNMLETENSNPYSKEILAAWDFSLTSQVEISDFSGSVGNKFLQMLEESRLRGIRRARSKYELLLIYIRRVIGTILYLMVVSASFTVIIYVTVYGSTISTEISKLPGLHNIESFIVPLILNMINGIVPMMLKTITHLEAWDSARTISNVILFRIYLSNMLNAMLVAFSYLVLVDPFLIAGEPLFRNSLGKEVSDNFSCRLDQAAEGLFTLVVFTWGLDSMTFIGMPIINRVLYFIQGKENVKKEFEVAEHMVQRLNLMGLVFMSLPFCPLTLMFLPIFLIIGFKWEKNVIKYFYSKPKRPWSGQQAGLIYTFFYFLTFIFMGIAVSVYFLTSKTFVKDCSLQDDYARLCASTIGVDNTCVLDTTSDYYSFYKNEQYPSSICKHACGPFVNEVTNLSPFHAFVTQNKILEALWKASFVYPYLPWFLVVVLGIFIAIVANSLAVQRLSAMSKEHSLETQIMNIEAERKKQDKIIKKLKSIEDDHLKDIEAPEEIVALDGKEKKL